MNAPQFQVLAVGDMYIAPHGVLTRVEDGQLEFIGAFGRMLVPGDVSARAARLMKYGRNCFEYIAAWCDRKLQQAYEQTA